MAKITLKSRLQNVGITGTQLYVTKPVTYSKISERELINMAANNSGVNSAMLYAAFDAFLLQVKEMLLNGHSINLENLGTFSYGIKCKSAKKVVDVSVANVKRQRIKFRPSPELAKQMKALGKNVVLMEDE